MDLAKKQYLDDCRKFFQEFSAENRVLIKYYQRKGGFFSNNQKEKRGVVILFQKNDELYVGYSLCHVNLGDKFDKYVGLTKAINNARPVSTLSVKNPINALVLAKKEAYLAKDDVTRADKLKSVAKSLEAELVRAIKQLPPIEVNSGKETREFPHSMAHVIAKAVSYANSYFKV